MSSRVIIIHGTEGSPKGNWFPWLKNKLVELGYTVLVPKFPTPENQSLNSWIDVFKKEVGDLTEDDILVGHSTGVIFILNILNNLLEPIKATYLISGFLENIGIEKYDNLNKSFLSTELNFDKISERSRNFFVYSGDNDPYVPRKIGAKLAKSLNVQEIIIKNGGHLNEEFGFTTFNDLLESIKNY